jgi:hypothetical protein
LELRRSHDIENDVSNQTPVRSAAGDSYPSTAAWAAHLIDQPYSAVHSRVPVVGIARVAGTGGGFEMRPGPGRWTDEAERRFAELKASEWAVVTGHHIEMQVAAWMLSTGQTEVELVLNREPCGNPIRWGCHQFLPVFLLRGYRLLVSGTRGGSQYYSYSYEGKARS